MDTTNTLKGIAISAVLINHYLNLNISGDFKGFAYWFVSLFFLLSGYGLFHSLNRRFAVCHFNFRGLMVFYLLRGLRIFPMLWAAWIIQFFVTSGKISFWILFGIHGQDHLWFVPALLQCYAVAPFIYIGIRKTPKITGTIIFIILILINFLIKKTVLPSILIYMANFSCSAYLKIYFLHILIFTAGIYVACLFSGNRIRIHTGQNGTEQISKSIGFCIFLLLTILTMMVLKYAGFNLPYGLNRMMDVLPVIMLIFLSVYALIYSIKISLFALIGSISYSIYLFHWSFYLLPDRFGNFPKDSPEKIILIAMLFPLFIFFCLYAEKSIDMLTNRFKTRFFI